MVKQLFAFSLFCYFALTLNAEVNSDSTITDSRNMASSLSSQITSSYTDNFNNLVALPVSSGTSVSTIDGSKSGTINITCSDKNILLSKISISGSNNISINVKIDADLNGSFERDYNFNGISGIHTKGVFTCSNGASSCIYYNWAYTSGSLTLSTIDNITAVAPYCINDSCGSKYSTNPAQILNDVSGIIVALIQSSTSLVVTNVNTTTTSAEIYAQNYNCSDTSTTPIYNSSSSIPSESTIQAQADTEATNSESNTIISTVLSNQSANPVSSSDLADIKTVANTSVNSASIDSSDSKNINYSSTYKDSSGNFVTTSSSSSINFEQANPEYCLVEWLETYSSVTTDDNVRGVTASGLRTTKKSESRLCSGPYNNICPLNTNAGESIKYDCGNLNKSINDAAASLNALKGIVDDMICNITK